ncbi:MAG: c-type cytochrome [Magnetovibrionaceae bacterium]
MRFILACLLAAFWLGSVAVAHTGATGIIKERMEGMKMLGSAMKTLKANFGAEASYDAKAVAEAARVLQAHSGEALTRRFPEGSLDHPTEALPAIWQDWSRFQELAGQLNAAAESLEALAPSGPDIRAETGGAKGEAAMPAPMAPMAPTEPVKIDSARSAFAAVAATCGACHEKFRKPKNK